ncbi:MAG: hypothetical protein AAGF50_04505 [Pseudomonadota bacterium]
MPMNLAMKGRLWPKDGSCVSLRPERRNHVWSHDVVNCRTDDGRLTSTAGIEAQSRAIGPSDLFLLRAIPSFIRSDNDPEFVDEAVRSWIASTRAEMAFLDLRSPKENGFVHSIGPMAFEASLQKAKRLGPRRTSRWLAPLSLSQMERGAFFYGLSDAQVLIGEGRKHYKSERLQGWLGRPFSSHGNPRC